MCFPNWSVIPFIAMLLSIAILPAIVPRWWEHNGNKFLVSAALSIPVLIVVIRCNTALLAESLANYFSFVTLISALFVIAGGIYIRGEFAGTPLINTVFLAVGAVLANLIGTTGASMLLIRPFIRANHRRRRKSHLVVFFIFIVSNIGGLLIPLGTPPFLGFLRGVPFFWTLRLFPHWALLVGMVLIAFNFFDEYVFLKEDVQTHGALAEDVQPRRHLHVQGSLNFVYLAGVMGAAVLGGYLHWRTGIPESLMIGMMLLSWFTTPRAIHRANEFRFHPMIEVAALFLGIFVTMIPALEILNARALSINLKEPWEFFWMSGGLSSFLDNAPAYLTFSAMASGLTGGSAGNLGGLLNSALGRTLLAAVSCGSVFMGAVTYIGNGPNFMVKSIAEHHGIKMPSFAGYMLYSCAILIPLFIIETLVFFPR